jgi:intraflagellar transport protein 56
VGAMTLLDLQKSAARDEKLSLWLAYAAFHAGEYKKSIEIYDELMRAPDYNPDFHIYKACCLYALCQYEDSYNECVKGDETSL